MKIQVFKCEDLLVCSCHFIPQYPLTGYLSQAPTDSFSTLLHPTLALGSCLGWTATDSFRFCLGSALGSHGRSEEFKVLDPLASSLWAYVGSPHPRKVFTQNDALFCIQESVASLLPLILQTQEWKHCFITPG